MACRHKFYDDLTLGRVDFEPDTLIVGTFNPEWPAHNTASWFYGRTSESCFWDVLPRIYGEPSLVNSSDKEWKRFCRDRRIALTDLIGSVDDADPSDQDHEKMLGGFSDKAIVHNFDDFEFVDIVQLLRSHPTIRNVYLTRGITEAFWRHLWSPVMHYCNVNGLYEQQLITPCGDAAYHHSAYNAGHPAAPVAVLEDYILTRWRQAWHF